MAIFSKVFPDLPTLLVYAYFIESMRDHNSERLANKKTAYHTFVK